MSQFSSPRPSPTPSARWTLGAQPIGKHIYGFVYHLEPAHPQLDANGNDDWVYHRDPREPHPAKKTIQAVKNAEELRPRL